MIYVSEIMTAQPYTLMADASISDAVKLMGEKTYPTYSDCE